LNQAMATKPADWAWVDSVVSTLFVSAGGRSSQHPAFNQTPLFDVSTDTSLAIPGNRPLLTFPRMGTHDMFPWGAFGADPTPEGCQAAWNTIKDRAHGGWPYSEVISDDINKFVFTQFYWSPNRPVAEIIREYVAFEYSPDVVEEVCGAIETLENNHTRLRWAGGMLIDRPGWDTANPEPAPRDVATDAAYETLKRVDRKLTAYARNNWRWRVLYLRALLDSELRKHGGKATTQCEAAFRELTEIYHAQKAEYPAKPPAPGEASPKLPRQLP